MRGRTAQWGCWSPEQRVRGDSSRGPSGLELRSGSGQQRGPRLGSWLPPTSVPTPQTVLLWSPRGAPAQPAGHDPRQTLHPYPCPPRLRKLGDPGSRGGEPGPRSSVGNGRDEAWPWWGREGRAR